MHNKILFYIITSVLLVSLGSIQEIFAQSSDSEIILEGNFNILEKTYENGTLAYDYFLFPDEIPLESSTYALIIETDKITLEQLFDLLGKNVRVVGEIVLASADQDSNTFLPNSDSIKVQSIELLSFEKSVQSSLSEKSIQSSSSESQFGLPIGRDVTPEIDAITILVKPPNNPLEPHPKSYFEEKFYNKDANSLASYYGANSYGNLDLTGTVLDWKLLPKTLGEYPSIWTVVSDAIAISDSEIDFNGDDDIIQNSSPNNFYIQENNGDDIDKITVITSGANKYDIVSSAFLSPVLIATDEGNLYVLLSQNGDYGNGYPVGEDFGMGYGVPAHETGHNFGLRHTPPHHPWVTTADPWSIMSNGAGTPRELIPGLISLQKYLAGWIPSENIFINTDGNDVTINLDYLETFPSQSENYLMGVIPLGENGEFYTLEARRNSEFSSTPSGGTPLERTGIIIYNYNPSGQLNTNSEFSKISGVPVNGLQTMSTNNLKEGETFYDYVNDVSIKYLSQTTDTITAEINYDLTKPSLENFLFEIGKKGTLNSQFNLPMDVAVDSSGRTYVVENVNSRVQVFDKDGNFLFKFETDRPASEPRSIPWGIDVDSDGIYVAEWNGFVQVFDKDGNFLFKFGERGSKDGQFISVIKSISVDSDRIYVLDIIRVQVFDKKGKFLFKFGEQESEGGQFGGAIRLTVDSEKIYVSDRNRVLVFDKEGNFLFKFGEGGSEDGQFNSPTGIAVDELLGKIYVADRHNARIQIFDLSGNFIDKFGTYGQYPTQLANMYGVAVNNQGGLIVADSSNFRIQAFDFLDPEIDNDGDGFTENQGDCDDTNNAVYPDAPEIEDGLDNDCDGAIDEGFIDIDGDGYTDDVDCNDNDALINPGATEIFDGVDNNCDGAIDEGFTDNDGDGYAQDIDDCNDNDALINPGAPEILDGEDNNCDGTIDEGLTDNDGDNYAQEIDDCNDNDALINPGATEILDGVDNNCDGRIDEGFTPGANLFVSAENSQFDNYMAGPMVIEVVVIDSDISDTNEGKGEPDVTVQASSLRMAQATDGNWYGYFANLQSANAADATQASDVAGVTLTQTKV